jgi:hypothetical protein
VLIFGLVFGKIFIWFGIGLMVIGGVSLARELIAERRARDVWRRREES